VDEAYVDYAGQDQSLEREACVRPNLIVLKSMSKVYALSGLRVGYLVAHPATVRALAPWTPPWSVSLPAQVAAIEALADPAYYQQKYLETHALREAALSGISRRYRASKCIRRTPAQYCSNSRPALGAQPITTRATTPLNHNCSW
jgi:histidinol-phosphate/aromatic aminotransferase/cobyric acid decarboxylase-like protein